MPKASGKIDGTTHASASASRWTRWRCSSGPVKSARVGRQRLELLPVVAESDDHRPRVEPASASSSTWTPLLQQELPEVDDGRLVAGEELREPLGVALVREPLVRVAGVRRVAARLLDESGQRLLPRLRTPLLDVDARRAPRARGRRGRRPPRRTSRMCAEPTNAACAPASTSLPHASSSGRPRIEYSSSEPCALTAYGRPRPRPPLRRAGRGCRGRGRPAAARAPPPRSPRPRRRARRECSPGAARPRSPRTGRGRTREGARRRRAARPARRRRRSRSGCGSWQRTVTSCPARDHSRASWRV